MSDGDENSKSLVLITRVGSTPTTGIKRQPRIERFWAVFVHIENHKLCLWKNRAVALKR